jgi:hypothetical protein
MRTEGFYTKDTGASPDRRSAAAVEVHRAVFSTRKMLIVAPITAASIWSLVEVRWELLAAHTSLQVLALIASKVVIIFLAVAALAGWTFPQVLFVFLCGVGVFAIGSALPMEYGVSKELFWLSAVECFIKAIVVASYTYWRVDRPSENLS